jgi:Probable lipoprotein LpqN
MSFGGLIPVRSPLDRLLTRLGAYCLRLSAHRVGLIKHGNDDAQPFENFKQQDASAANFPSSMIQGSYDLDGTRLHSWNRIVIPTGSPPADQRYLVQLTITRLADQAAAQVIRHRGDHPRIRRRRHLADPADPDGWFTPVTEVTAPRACMVCPPSDNRSDIRPDDKRGGVPLMTVVRCAGPLLGRVVRVRSGQVWPRRG